MSKKRIVVTAKEILDEGYRKAYVPKAERNEKRFPRADSLEEGKVVHSVSRAVRRKAPREAAFITMLRESGIGRPSTYIETMEKLRKHEYVEPISMRMPVTERGRAALKWLQTNYPDLFSVDFSVRMEEWLDEVAAGKRSYREAVGAVWEMLQGEES